MGPSPRRFAAGLTTTLLAGLALSARAATPEAQRAQLLRDLGLKKGAPATPAPAPASPPAETASPPPPAAASGPKGAATGVPSAGPSFRRVVHPSLMQTCTPCHATGGPGAATRMKLTGDAGADHATVLRLVDLREPGASPLLAKPSGAIHAGGAPWPPTSPAYGRVLAWIQHGAHLDGAAAPAAALAGAPLAAVPSAPRAKEVAPPVADLPAPPVAGLPAPPPPAAAAPADAAASPAVDFATAVHPLLMSACATCHGPKGPAAATRFVLSGEPAADEAIVERHLDLAAPARSPLLTKSGGQLHGGGVVIPAGDARHALLLAWITEVSKRAPSGAAPTLVGPVGAPSSPTPTPPAAPPPPTRELLVAPPRLPLGFALDGRFDVTYERRQFSGDPFASGGVDALRSYHHFLFLSRESTDDPFGLSLELLSLQFWEVHTRLGGLPRGRAWQLVLSAGKLLVPFGADPLMHQSYGGVSGFDQRILPVIWAQEGVAAHLLVQRGPVALTDDLFVVRGYGLRAAAGVLNLQNDFSPEDDVHLGWGNRLGASWLDLSAWYSTYFNPLGFGRRLFMQAVDVMLSRPRRVPVLGHFSAGAGYLRADVSGGAADVGGPGHDYYHFGSYLQLRYHPTDWLYLQYRQGLRTFDNRRGVIVDDSRLTAQDGSAHNFGVVARCRGVSLGVYYFINLEKVDEVPDDIFRVSLTYDF